MATVFDVARYILHKKGSMSTMKLQKLVFYCQAWSLAWDGVPLFEDEFEAWANGPVCPTLYQRHKDMFRVGEDNFPDGRLNVFSDTEKESLKAVLDYYGDKEPHWLSELTHLEAPWMNARKGVAPGMPCNNIISKESMQVYYGGLV